MKKVQNSSNQFDIAQDSIRSTIDSWERTLCRLMRSFNNETSSKSSMFALVQHLRSKKEKFQKRLRAFWSSSQKEQVKVEGDLWRAMDDIDHSFYLARCTYLTGSKKRGKPMKLLRTDRALQCIRDKFGDRVVAPYAKAKTAFRNRIYDAEDCSLLEAEKIVDTLELRHRIRFELVGSSPPRPTWFIQSAAA